MTGATGQAMHDAWRKRAESLRDHFRATQFKSKDRERAATDPKSQSYWKGVACGMRIAANRLDDLNETMRKEIE